MEVDPQKLAASETHRTPEAQIEALLIREEPDDPEGLAEAAAPVVSDQSDGEDVDAKATSDSDAPAPAEDAEEEETPVEAAAPEESEEDVYDSLASIATALEIPEKAFLEQIQVEDAAGESIPLSQVLASYRAAPQAQTELGEAQRARQDYQAERQRVVTEHEGALKGLAEATQIMMAQLEGDEGGVDWKKLKEEDPTEFVAKRQEMQDRRGRVQHSFQLIRDHQEKASGEAAEERKRFQRDEWSQLLTVQPDWKDPAKSRAASEQITSYLRNKGFTDSDINDLIDHRVIQVAYEASELERVKAAVPKVKKKLKGARKGLRAVARDEPGHEKSEKTRKLGARLRRTGKDEDAAKLIEALL